MTLFTKPAQLIHGPALIGIFLNIALYGVMLAQCTFYFITFRHKDNYWLKAYVLLLLVADTVNTVLNICWIYDVLINHFDDLGALKMANWVFASDPALVGIIATMVQLFFAYRVRVLSRSLWLIVLIVVTALASALGGVGTAIAIKYVPDFTQFQQFSVIVIVWLFCAALCDIAITLSMTYHLRKYQNGFNPETDSVLNRIIKATVQNGLITTIWSIVDLALFLASPTGLHLAFNYPLAKLYSNSALSALNARPASYNDIINSAVPTTTRPISCQSLPYRQPKTVGEMSERRMSDIPKTEVFVDVETHVDRNGAV